MLGWAAGVFTAPFSHSTLALSWAHAGKIPSTAGMLLVHGGHTQEAEARVASGAHQLCDRQEEAVRRGMLPSPRGLYHTGAQVHPPNVQEESYSTSPDVGKTQLKIMNILHYISLMKDVDTCMDQAPLQLSNRI